VIRNLFNKVRSDPFLRDNAILFMSLSLLNILGYLFHFYIGRALGPEGYSIVGALLSIMYIITVPLYTIQTGMASFVSKFKVKEEFGKIAYLFRKSLRKMLIYGFIISVGFIIISPLVAKFLNMDNLVPLFVLALFMFFALLLPINRGLLQGLQRFKGLGLNYILEGITKLGSALIFIPLGLGVSGAVGSFALSFFIPFVLAFFILGKWLKVRGERFNTKELYAFSLPVLIMLAGMTLFYTLDVILVKHFFDSLDAGYYAAASLLSKILFFGTLSISVVLFPKVTELHAKDKATKQILVKSIGLVLLFCIPVTLFYFLFPEFVINLLFGKDYLAASKIVGMFALTITIFSINYLMSFYAVAIGKRKFIWLIMLLAILMVLSIWFIHNTLLNVILILLVLNILLFIIMFIITLKK